MKQLIIVLVAIIGLTSCKTTVETKPTTHKIGGGELMEITIEDCQYLYGPWGNSSILTHKGNCKNPIHPEHTRQ